MPDDQAGPAARGQGGVCGVCGMCRVRLVAGEVRMGRNFALEQAEFDAGLVLTRQSLPVTAELTVDYDA